LPEHESARSDLVAIDGMVETILERHFSRRPRAATLDADSHLALQQCQRDHDGFAKSLSSEASQYFGRAQVLIGFVLSREMANTANALLTTADVSLVFCGRRRSEASSVAPPSSVCLPLLGPVLSGLHA